MWATVARQVTASSKFADHLLGITALDHRTWIQVPHEAARCLPASIGATGPTGRRVVLPALLHEAA
jgi:hypothetical protein